MKATKNNPDVQTNQLASGRRIKLALVALLCCAISSCTPTLHPLFTHADRTYDPELAGIWLNHEQDNKFTLAWFAEGKIYSLRTELKDQPATPGDFNAILGKIGKHRFLNLVPKRPTSLDAKSFYGGHFIQTFTFWKVDLKGDKLTLTPLNYQWVEAMIKAKKLGIKYEQQDGGFITLTASTEELKAFVLKYADDSSAFSGGLQFERKK